jgi:predicted chitinase
MDAATPVTTAEEIFALMPECKYERVVQYEADLNAAMAEFEINTPRRRAAFLAQIAHESAELRFFEELTDGAAYEHRTDLGNYADGDGHRYKGRGPIQLTGKRNYREAGHALGLDLINHPRLAAVPKNGFRIAAWYWQSHGLNVEADLTETDPKAFDRITFAINGGLTGKKHRDAYFIRALRLAALASDPLVPISEGAA